MGELAGVLIWTSARRFPAMGPFYVDVLGLKPRHRRDDFVNFEWGKVRLTVSVHDDVDGSARDPLRIMVNLAVDDIDAQHRRLGDAGGPCLRAPEQEPWGGWVATFTDPDGNIVQLMQL